MANLFATIRDEFHGYIHEIPRGLPINAAKGFIATSVVTFVSGSTIPVALLGGSIAVLASTIEALTRPIIKSIFPTNIFVGEIIQVFLPIKAAFKLADLATPIIGFSYKLVAKSTSFFVLPIIAWIALNNSDWYRNNIAIISIIPFPIHISI